jgi:cytochrome bd-type quinol oxidase subunit 2
VETALAMDRLHFVFTATFHYLFPQLTMGFGAADRWLRVGRRRAWSTSEGKRRFLFLDWSTVLVGVLALAALVVHGTLWVRYKTGGELSARAEALLVGHGVSAAGDQCIPLYTAVGCVSRFRIDYL